MSGRPGVRGIAGEHPRCEDRLGTDSGGPRAPVRGLVEPLLDVKASRFTLYVSATESS